MQKIRLEVDRLRVESFEPAPHDTALRGTVRGHVTAYWELCYPTQTEDPNVNTCGPTQNSCVYTCFEQTCYQCGTGACTGNCTQTQDPNVAACTGTCYPIDPGPR